MPELPEVQTVVQELDAHLSGRQFAAGAEAMWERSVGFPDAALFTATLAGRKVAAVRRRAKYILIDLDDRYLLVVHLRMTGNLHFASPATPPHRYLRVRMPLTDGSELRFADMRKFGRLCLGREEDFHGVIPLDRLGPEPLAQTFTPEVFAARLAGSTGAIKPLLLDQTVVAGIGNIYADEALYYAGIDPRRPAGSLSFAEVIALHAGIQTVLLQALGNGGTSFRNYLSTWGHKGSNQEQLMVFRRDGEACNRCGSALQRLVVGGRGTHICPNCQH